MKKFNPFSFLNISRENFSSVKKVCALHLPPTGGGPGRTVLTQRLGEVLDTGGLPRPRLPHQQNRLVLLHCHGDALQQGRRLSRKGEGAPRPAGINNWVLTKHH